MTNVQEQRVGLDMLDMPDGPGYWAFEGHDLKTISIYSKDGKEFRGWQEEWNEYYHDKDNSWWNENYGDEPKKLRREYVPNKPLRTIMLVRYSQSNDTVKTRDSYGNHRGETQILGYQPSHDYYYNVLHTLDLLVGTWTRVYMPWDIVNDKGTMGNE